jgi:hypothetical protein
VAIDVGVRRIRGSGGKESLLEKNVAVMGFRGSAGGAPNDYLGFALAQYFK